jgi:hypothetical protein
MAAFCAIGTAAALGSQHLIFRTAPASVPRFEIPLDPDVNGPDVDAGIAGMEEPLPGIKPEKLDSFSRHNSETAALAPAAFSAATLFAFGAVVILSQRNLRARPGRRRRGKHFLRPMAFL